LLANRLKNKESPVDSEEVVTVMIADAKRLLAAVHLIKKKFEEQ
jgi:hypothetical protein